MRRVLFLTLVCLLLSGAAALAAEPLTLGALKAAGVQPMTKAQAEAFAAQGKVYGEVGGWDQPLRLFPDGALRGESCGKGQNCSSPAKGTGKWSVDEDGTFRLFLDWGRWGQHDWVGKLYVHEGYVYQFRGDDEAQAAGYRFKQ